MFQDNYTRLLVATGSVELHLAVEIIDLSEQGLVCQLLNDFPQEIMGAGEFLRTIGMPIE